MRLKKKTKKDVRRSRRYDFTTFLARGSQRRGGARTGVARARPSLPRTTASRKNEREKRSRDREIPKNGPRATRASGFEILARESSKDYKHIEIYRNRSWRHDFPRSLEPAPRRCESERSAGTTLTAEGYREPQERARKEVEGQKSQKTALEPRERQNLKYSHVRAERT